VAKKKQQWVSFRSKADDLAPREIGNGIIRCRAEHLASLSIELPEEIMLDGQQVSKDDKAGIAWYRGTEEVRRLLNVEDDEIPEQIEAQRPAGEALLFDGPLDLSL
jgi:hypothetical protein